MKPRFASIMRPVLALVAGMTLAAAPARAVEPAVLAEARATAYAAQYDSVEALVAAHEQLAALSAANPDSPLLHYWVAYSDYRLIPRMMMRDKKQADRYCDDGVKHMDQAIAADPKNAEYIALKSGVMGLSIMVAPMRGMTVGNEIGDLQNQARALAPDNPRVALMEGINTMNKPGFVGGGAKKALPQLERAIALFAKAAPSDSTAIDWGYDDAYTWAGRAAAKLDKPAEARGYYQKALEINPQNGWVRYGLLPALDKAEKKEKS